MGRKSSTEEVEKPHRLSLAELAAHDDACSDAMVDNAFFKSQIRKNRTKYTPLRGIKDEQIPQILLHKVIVDKDLVAAEKEILQIPGIKRYRSTLRSRPEKENFKSHLRKYIAMYMTDSPWEVSTTNRYTITTYEAAVTARQRIKQGQVIKYLIGTLVPLTTAESADLDLTNRNFSIVVSSRKKNSSIFLGPARFANHDCDANGRLVTRGSDGMEVVAVKNIEVGDEITVSYGDDYFGPGNMDCLCRTCEQLVRNGWSGAKEVMRSRATSNHSSNDPPSPEPGRGKRKRGSEFSVDESLSAKPLKLPRLKPSPSKLHQSWTPPVSADSDSVEDLPPAQTGQILDAPAVSGELHDPPRLSPPSSPNQDTTTGQSPDTNLLHDLTSTSEHLQTNTALNKITSRILGNLPATKQCPSPVSAIESPVDPDMSSDPDTIVVKVETVEVHKLETDDPPMLSETALPTPSTVFDLDAQPAHALTTLTTTQISKAMVHQVDELVPSIELSVTLPAATITTSKITVQQVPDYIRVPGDYFLTRKLLAQPHDRWVECHNDRCRRFFIQPNGYQTRRECPRCERHSMLYGFSWPKTDPDPRKVLERGGSGSGRGRGRAKKLQPARSAYKRAGRCGKGSWVEGGGDEEERVMDHRTVHRFVMPDDERATTRKGLLKMADVARLTGDDFVDHHDGTGIGNGRQAIRSTESLGFDSSDARSLTPEGGWAEAARRRSNRFVTTKVYTDV